MIMAATDPFEVLARMSPPADEVRVARVRARVEHLRRLPDDAPRGTRRSHHGLVVAVVAVAAAVLSGSTVAAAANGAAPEPVTRALVSVGVLDAEAVPASPEPPPRAELAETLREDLDLAQALTDLAADLPVGGTFGTVVFAVPAERVPDVGLTVLVSDVPEEVTQIVLELPDSTIALTRTPEGRFVGALVPDALVGSLIALTRDGTEVGRIELAPPSASAAVGQS
jgi:hypothetical protein